ncbi:hypothetical protein [Roseiterribacter gracilis]|uniref:Uncharacterized protein n=1 Tax=Roseiterribacter gracilis TaxID=2812848 RepID=A0A8S8X9P8_9PROT|nr:hypothetical protein TMPK1_02920 [Rhodospirillales bacterium TMPK1]
MANPSARDYAENQREAALGTTQKLIQQQAARATNPPMSGNAMRPVLVGMGMLLVVGVVLFGVGWPLMQKLIGIVFAKLNLA